MKVWLQTDKVSGKIVAIRIDGKMTYRYNPEYIPYGVKNITIEINDFTPIKGDHIIG